MVRLAKKTHRHLGHSRIIPGNLPHKRLALAVSVGLVLAGTVAVLVTFASTGRVDTLVTIGDEAGGFHNALVAINPENGTKVGSLIAPSLANLAGCSLTQPKPYLYDMAVDTKQGLALAGLKPCRGGRLNAGQVVARFNVVAMRFDRYLDGPVEGVSAIRVLDSGGFTVLNTSGTEVWIYSPEGDIRHKVNLGGSATRFGAVFGGIMVAYADGSIDNINVVNGVREKFANTGLPLSSQTGIDGFRILQAGDMAYLLSQGTSQSHLVTVSSQKQVQSYALGSTATSFDISPGGEVLMVATGCPTGTSCTQNPNRLYAFQTAAKRFQSTEQFEYLPLQTSPARLRFDSVGEKIYFDGVVTGSNGVGQRFVFSLELNSTQLLAARIAVPSSAWIPVGVDPRSINLDSQTPAVDVPTDIPKGGGIGSGGISAAPVPLDEIERLLGMSIWEIDWSKITDEQIRAFGYEPAEVRRYIAQLRLRAGSAATIGNSETITCRLGEAAGADQIAAIERVLGVSLLQFDFNQVTDEQIQAFGYNPSEVRQVVAKYKQNAGTLAKNGGDPCANTYTQDAFVVDQGTNTAAVASGTVTQVTAQAKFDLFGGGWLVNLRWQAPGGAKKFHIYGRDESTHKLERQLAAVDGLQRSVRFGGFNRISLPALHDAEYTLAVVPEQSDGTMGAPTAIKTRVRCYIVWCQASGIAK